MQTNNSKKYSIEVTERFSNDLIKIAKGYEEQQKGLSGKFLEKVDNIIAA